MSMSATMPAGAVPGPAKNAGRCVAGWAAGGIAINLLVKVLCMLATVIGLLFLASILMTLIWRGVGGPVAHGVHHHHPAARLEWRPAQCDRRHA